MLMGKSFDSPPPNWMVGDFHNIFFIFFSSRVFPPPKIQLNRKRIDDENPIVCLVCVSKITWYKKHESDGNEKRIEKNKYQIEHREREMRWILTNVMIRFVVIDTNKLLWPVSCSCLETLTTQSIAATQHKFCVCSSREQPHLAAAAA